MCLGLFEYDKHDYKSWAHGLKAAGYATNPQYGHILIRIIEENNLAIPTLVGSIFINASGINALIQSLGEMGLLPAQQAGFAQMMLGMFTVPGDAPDTLKTEIQLTEDGGILANGQRLQ